MKLYPRMAGLVSCYTIMAKLSFFVPEEIAVGLSEEEKNLIADPLPKATQAEKDQVVVARAIILGWCGYLSIFDSTISPKFVYHTQNVSGLKSGPEGLKQLVTKFRKAFPDLRVEVLRMMTNDSGLVTSQLRMRGTNTGERFLDVPYVTGRKIDIQIAQIDLVQNGLITEHWGYPDRLGALEQLGVFPPSPVSMIKGLLAVGLRKLRVKS